jgi:hypothetical protein
MFALALIRSHVSATNSRNQRKDVEEARELVSDSASRADRITIGAMTG